MTDRSSDRALAPDAIDARSDSAAVRDAGPVAEYERAELDYAALPDYQAGTDHEDGELDYAALPDYQADPGYDGDVTGPGAEAPVVVDAAPANDLGTGSGDSAQRPIADAKDELVARQGIGEILGGDPINRADLWHPQGDNDTGYQQDCALAATSEVLRDCGVDSTENDMARQAAANGWCETGNADPADNGGVRDGQAVSDLLNANGVDSRVEYPADPDDLARWVEQDHGVITEVNAGELWDDRGGALTDAYAYDMDGRAMVNHAVQVTGTTRDAGGQLTGFVVNDTGMDDGAARLVPMSTWDRCWTNTDRNHETIVTVLPTSAERMGR